MDENLKPVFDVVYKTQIEPYLEDIEKRRVKILEEFKEKAIAYFSIAVIIVFVLPIDGSIKAFILFCVFPLVYILAFALSFKTFPIEVKDKLLPVILSVFGDFHRLKTEAITFEELKEYKIFPKASFCNTDDIIAGKYKNLDIIIQESSIHNGTGVRFINKETGSVIKDTSAAFYGLIIKVTSNKTFTGTTIVRPDEYYSDAGNLHRVYLEDPAFEKIYNVYSTDQIEARYLLTTAFMERLQKAGNSFTRDPEEKNRTYCVFDKGHVFLFLSSGERFFEVFSPFNTIKRKELYERVYEQMVAIFELIEELKLDQNIGM